MMQLRIADKFQDSLTRLSGEEQKATKLTLSDLQLNPENPGLSFHKLDRAKDKRFWSVRVNGDIRLIVHRSGEDTLVCFVGHHDAAYDWAERRKLETHPRTGAAQLVEIRETVREIEVPVYIPTEKAAEPTPAEKLEEPRPLLADVSDDDLLAYGVPEEWLADVRAVDDDLTLERLSEHLPDEAAEALLDLATGGKPALPVVAPPNANPFEHPDAQRRFFLVESPEELQRALDYPWDKWTVFLHPEQREMVARDYSGPARVAGSAGTGKTVVAIHRAAHLARANPDARVLLTTFSPTLAAALRTKLRRLLGSEPRVFERIAVDSIDEVGLRSYSTLVGEARVADSAVLEDIVRESSAEVADHLFTDQFLLSEWTDLVDAWQVSTWDEYREVPRLGRKTRLGEKQRKVVWDVCERVRGRLEERALVTMPQVFSAAAAAVADVGSQPFDYAVVDEAQDISIPQLRYLAELVDDGENGLFFAGDLGQRIFRTPFSWLALGVDVRGRSKTLRVNYRTSHEIRRHADKLLPNQLSDVDGNAESRRGTVSVFSGEEPGIELVESEDTERTLIAKRIERWIADGLLPHEIAVFVRSEEQIERATSAIQAAGLTATVLDGTSDGKAGSVAVTTMELAKGLEFRAVVVAACDDEVIPSQKRIESIGDFADLEDVWETERHLLYVACTRARDHLLVTGVVPGSEFLGDMS